VDHAYAIEKLSRFLEDVNLHLAHIDAAATGKDTDWPDCPQDLKLDLVLARQIVDAYAPYQLGELHQYDSNSSTYWQLVRLAVIEALGHAKSADEVAAFLRPSSPSIAADALHPWVWEPAAPLWAADAHQDAVLAACRTVNRRLQQKLERHDISETGLCMQSFSPDPPIAGKPRLRFAGDRSTLAWKSRQDGAKYIAAGAFLAIRNLAAHEDQVTWTKQEALEYLATFSVIARWIEECTVETAT
jgi:hypothetical protein